MGFINLGSAGVSPALAAQKMSDQKGFKDSTMFTRMPNYYLPYASSFKEKQFDAYEFRVTEGKKETKQRVEGHFVEYCYYFDHSAGTTPSSLQIIRNYQTAAGKIGAQMLYEQVNPGNALRTTFKLVKENRETWAEVESGGGNTYYLRIVERQQMLQQVSASAEALEAGLAQNGHVEVPGIFFDFGKADIKPESEPALAEIAKLLNKNPGVRVWVVGHTDYIGSAVENVTLAQARAAGVVKVLTQKHGIDAKRLSPYGVGPYAPVGPNTTEEGRAKNRRVELVAQP
jgi:outer membrane protein OmpA-like peptidoglycan-associated protein